MSRRSNLAVVIRARGALAVEDHPMPVPRADEALVRVRYGGICGSDLHYWKDGRAGSSVLREPMVLGHEMTGEVATAASDGSSPAAGSPVTVHPGTAIGKDGVDYPTGRPNIAPRVTYLGSAAHSPHTQGVFARYVALPSHMLRPVPTGVTAREAALTEPASVAWHAVVRAGDVTGKHALVIGAGPIGALVVAVLRARGAAHITAIDVHETPLRLAHSLGATRTLTAHQADAIASLGADIVIESSGTAAGLDSAMAGARPGGTVVMVGLLADGDLPRAMGTAITRELDLRGSFRFASEIDDVLAAMGSGLLAIEEVVTHEFPAEQALSAFETAADSAASSKVLLRF